MLYNCECGKTTHAKASHCTACGKINPYDGVAKVKRGACEVLWCLLLVGSVIFFFSFISMLGRAENVMQQIFACADTLTWVVLSYVMVRAITSALGK